MKTCCRKYLKSYSGALGMRACVCTQAFYHFAPGWAKPYDSNRVYHLGEYVGTPIQYGELQALVAAAGPALERTPAPGELFA